MKVELTPDSEDALVIHCLRRSLRCLREQPETAREPDDDLLEAAIRRVLKYYLPVK